MVLKIVREEKIRRKKNGIKNKGTQKYPLHNIAPPNQDEWRIFFSPIR
jgi:hypothetical protein